MLQVPVSYVLLWSIVFAEGRQHYRYDFMTRDIFNYLISDPLYFTEAKVRQGDTSHVFVRDWEMEHAFHSIKGTEGIAT